MIDEQRLRNCVVGKWHMKQFPRGTSDYAVTVGQGSYFNPTLHRPDGKREKYQGYYADRYTDWAPSGSSSATKPSRFT